MTMGNSADEILLQIKGSEAFIFKIFHAVFCRSYSVCKFEKYKTFLRKMSAGCVCYACKSAISVPVIHSKDTRGPIDGYMIDESLFSRQY